MIRGFRKALETSDLWLLRKEETVDFNRNLFAPKWEPAMQQWRMQQAALEAQKKQQDANAETTANPRVGGIKKSPSPDAKLAPSETPGNGNKAIENRNGKVEKEEKKNESTPKPPLLKMLLKVYWPPLLLSQLLVVIYVIAYFSNPLLLWYAVVLFSTKIL